MMYYLKFTPMEAPQALSKRFERLPRAHASKGLNWTAWLPNAILFHSSKKLLAERF